jgi:hypothetical protein
VAASQEAGEAFRQVPLRTGEELRHTPGTCEEAVGIDLAHILDGAGQVDEIGGEDGLSRAFSEALPPDVPTLTTEQENPSAARRSQSLRAWTPW